MNPPELKGEARGAVLAERPRGSGVRPRFPFGFGLSYTSFTFTFTELELDEVVLAPGQPRELSVRVKNVGQRRRGGVQAYVRELEPSLPRPVRG